MTILNMVLVQRGCYPGGGVQLWYPQLSPVATPFVDTE